MDTMAAEETAAMGNQPELLDPMSERDMACRLLPRLKHASLTSRAALEAEFGRLGLTVTQFLTLAHIEGSSDISSAELARRSYVTPQAMTTIVARMEAAGLIRRTPANGGGRVISLALTPEGERLLEQGRVHAVAIEKYLLDQLGDTAYRELLQSLDTMTSTLSQAATLTRATPWQKYLPPEERAEETPTD
jgi:DNA-binding MarR family transcriptional regulator